MRFIEAMVPLLMATSAVIMTVAWVGGGSGAAAWFAWCAAWFSWLAYHKA